MRVRFRESELVESPPHRAEIRFSLGVCRPLPASGARNARTARQSLQASETAH
jgi:nitrite reductase/ring-hydroxylating ferredoxin subunit